MRNRPATISKSILAVLTALLLAGPSAFGQSKSNEQEPQRPDVIKLDTALVTVPVFVTDRYGRFVTGLARRDFAVFEDGAQQDIASFSSTEAPFNVALLIDTSRSTRNKLGAIRKAALEFIKQLQPNDRVLIVTFDEKVQFINDFTSDHKELERAIHAVKSSYLTSLYDAVYRTVVEKLAPLQGRKAIVLLTDGVDTASKLATYESTLELVSSSGVISYAIQYETRNDGGPVMKPIFVPSIPRGSFVSPFINRWQGQSAAQGQSQPQSRSEQPAEQDKQKDRQPINILSSIRASTGILSPSSSSSSTAPRPSSQGAQPIRDRYLIAANYLHDLATQSGARYLRAESIENTTYAFALIADELRHQYTLTYYSTNDKRDGNYRTIAVNLGRNDLSVRTRQGYRAPKGSPPEAGNQGPEKKATGEKKPE